MKWKWHHKRNQCGEEEGVSVYCRSRADPGKSMLLGMDSAGTISNAVWVLHMGTSLLFASDCLLSGFLKG